MRKKIRKHRGDKTGGGAKKKRRGAGNRGGRGRAGLTKHKKSLAVKQQIKRPSLKPSKKQLKVINLNKVNFLLIQKDLKEIELKGYKVLGTGTLSQKAKIKADVFSKKALQKIKDVKGEPEILIKPDTKEDVEEAVKEKESVQNSVEKV